MKKNMNIQGLDYNTQREKLVLPEYGREIQKMVDHCLTLTDRNERQRCAESIISIMKRMFPEGMTQAEKDRKFWDHLAIMSGFQLDIDYPYDIAHAAQIAKKPEPMDYPMKRIPVRHYGAMMFGVFEKLEQMEPGAERDALVELTANQMRRDLMQWSHGSADEEKVASDLSRYTHGKIQLDLDTFKFAPIRDVPYNNNNNNNGKKRK